MHKDKENDEDTDQQASSSFSTMSIVQPLEESTMPTADHLRGIWVNSMHISRVIPLAQELGWLLLFENWKLENEPEMQHRSILNAIKLE